MDKNIVIKTLFFDFVKILLNARLQILLDNKEKLIGIIVRVISAMYKLDITANGPIHSF
jgi:small nuclear ribonucleoprotein (snRNP)-like protein